MGLRDALRARVKAAVFGERPTPPPPPQVGTTRIVAPATPSATPTVAGAQTIVGTEFRSVGPSSAVQVGKAGMFAHAGKVVAVFRHDGRLHAMDNACAHEDGPIGEGAIDGTCVACPYHNWQYDFTTGACLTDPERPRATFEVVEHEGLVWLGPQKTPGSDARGGDHDDGMEVIRR
ncbi:MAG: Rieske (2Fe-2S) protein [Myxococcales bacterium]|nr:Rieske (2Fe-2S) protein [Myxococcales bacterium]